MIPHAAIGGGTKSVQPPTVPDLVEVVEPNGYTHVISRSEFEALRREKFFRDRSTVRGYFDEHPIPIP